MQSNKIIVPFALIFATLIPIYGFSGERNDFVVSKQPLNLMTEANAIDLNAEKSIQNPVKWPMVFVSLSAGMIQPGTIVMTSGQSREVRYDFTRPAAYFSTGFEGYPWSVGNGRWGWSASLGISYSEGGDKNPTALYLIPATAAVAYRYERKNTQMWVPFAKAGPSVLSAVQRGTDQNNTSSALLGGTFGAGVAFNLNRAGWFGDSRTQSELILQYQRVVASQSAGSNWNGNTLQFGALLAL